MTKRIRTALIILGVATLWYVGAVGSAAVFRGAAAQQRVPLSSASGVRPRNILLIIGDDMGVETLRSYGVGTDPASTPTLDRLAASGVRFNRFWSQPVCSPTRATLLTGRYGFRTGVGRPTGDGEYAGSMPPTPPKPTGAAREGRGGPPGAEGAQPEGAAAGRVARGGRSQGAGAGRGQGPPPAGPGLKVQEFTLPKAFKAHPERGYATAAIGKWHLADKANGWNTHPNLAGFDHFSGLVRGFPEGYFAWIKDVDGALSGATGYAPSDNVDDATRWIRARGERPWFLWLAFNLPHDPLHLPPRPQWVTDHSDLDPQADPDANPRPYFKAMMEALDTEIGRLLESIDPAVRANTYVVFMGDNGSTRRTVTGPFDPSRAKGTVYEGGVNVPLIVSGPGVAENRASDALVNSADMFATIMEMAGIVPRTTVPDGIAVDSVSFLPYLSQPGKASIRQWIYADTFGADEGIERGQYAIRNRSYKLVVSGGQEELYDLTRDRAEARNLLGSRLTREQQAAYQSLRRQVTVLHASEKKN